LFSATYCVTTTVSSPFVPWFWVWWANSGGATTAALPVPAWWVFCCRHHLPFAHHHGCVLLPVHRWGPFLLHSTTDSCHRSFRSYILLIVTFHSCSGLPVPGVPVEWFLVGRCYLHEQTCLYLHHLWAFSAGYILFSIPLGLHHRLFTFRLVILPDLFWRVFLPPQTTISTTCSTFYLFILCSTFCCILLESPFLGCTFSQISVLFYRCSYHLVYHNSTCSAFLPVLIPTYHSATCPVLNDGLFDEKFHILQCSTVLHFGGPGRLLFTISMTFHSGGVPFYCSFGLTGFTTCISVHSTDLQNLFGLFLFIPVLMGGVILRPRLMLMRATFLLF